MGTNQPRWRCLSPPFERISGRIRDTTKQSAFIWMEADELVRGALRDLDRGRVISVPGALNRLMVATSTMAPATLTRKISGRLSSRFK